MTTIYIASKAKHAARWLALRNNGLPVISTWIDEPEPGAWVEGTGAAWAKYTREAATADVVLAYGEEGEVQKGALVEIGCALGAGKKVFLVGPFPGSWVDHPRVVKCDSIEHALDAIKLYEVEGWHAGG